MPKRAIRLHNILDDLSNIDAGKGHIDHMYSGQLSRYYYRRFDQALRLAEIGSSDRVLQIGGGTGVFSLSLAEYANNVHFTDVKQYVDFDAVQQLLRK